MGIIYSESHNATGPGQNSSPTQSTHYLGNKEREAVTKIPQSIWYSVGRALLPWSVQMGKKYILQINGKREGVFFNNSV